MLSVVHIGCSVSDEWTSCFMEFSSCPAINMWNHYVDTTVMVSPPDESLVINFPISILISWPLLQSFSPLLIAFFLRCQAVGSTGVTQASQLPPWGVLSAGQAEPSGVQTPGAAAWVAGGRLQHLVQCQSALGQRGTPMDQSGHRRPGLPPLGWRHRGDPLQCGTHAQGCPELPQSHQQCWLQLRAEHPCRGVCLGQ